MHIKDTIDTGNGWILPDSKCLEISITEDNIKGLREHNPNIDSLFLSKNPKDSHSFGQILDQLYHAKYVRVGKYRDTVLFEHGPNHKPTKHQMVEIVKNVTYRGIPVTYRSSLYNNTDTTRKRFFCDK